MKKILILPFILISFLAKSQAPPNIKINQSYYWNFGAFNGLHAPGFNGTPVLRANQWTGSGAIGVDTINHKFYFYSGGSWRQAGSGSVATSNPIINKSNVTNGLSLNFPLIQDGGTSSTLGTFDLSAISINTIPSPFTDGIIGFNWRDSAIVMIGGCNNVAPSADTVRISTDGGVTFSVLSHFPYAFHAVPHIASLDGYYYVIGGDPFGTSTQQKTVTRTKDFSTWQTMTTNAAFGARTLEAGWEWQGALFVGGGQDGAAGPGVFNDIWRSDDNGITWTLWNSSAMAGSDSVMEGNAYNCVASFNGALYKIMSNLYPSIFRVKCFKSLDGGLSWKRIADYPSSAVSYPSLVVWDGKLWVMNGYNGSANTSNFFYLDKTDTWNSYNNFSGADKTLILSATHAGDCIVFRDHVINLLGNNKNDVWSIFRSNYSQGFIVKDSTRWNWRTFLGESTNALEGIFSNGGKIVPATSQGMVKTTSDNALGVILTYNNGILFQTGISGASGTTYSTTSNIRGRIDHTGNWVIGSAASSGHLLDVNGTLSVTGAASMNSAIFSSDVQAARVGIGIAPSYTLHVNSAGTNTIANFKNNNTETFLGADANEFFIQPLTASRGVGIYNAAGTAIIQALPAGGNKITGNTNFVNKIFAGDGTTTPTALIHLAAGTTSANTAPLKFTSSSAALLTNVEAGAEEVDANGIKFYTKETTAGRGYVPDVQRFRLTSNGSTISTIANFFGSTSNPTLVSGAEYIIEIDCYYTNTTAGTVTWTFTNSAAPTSQNIHARFSPAAGIVAPAGSAAATYLEGDIQGDATAALALSTSPTLTDATTQWAHFSIHLYNNTGTSFKIQATKLVGGTITPLKGSYWTVTRVPAGNTGIFVN